MSKTSNVDYQTMRPMLELSAQEVFQIMLGSKVQPADNSDHEEKFDFTSMVGLAGQLCGVVILRCRSESAALMASMMLGTKLIVDSNKIDFFMIHKNMQ